METNGHYLGYIHDGQARQGYVAEVDRLHPAVKFDYRPMLLAERDIVMKQVEDGDARRATEVLAATIAKRVVNWNLKRVVDGELQDVPISVEHARRLQPVLAAKIYTIVLGNRSSDAEPDAPYGDPDKALRELEAALDGRPSEDSQAGREGN